MSGFFAVVLPILIIVGAFMWLQPSKRDQHLSKLRSEALLKGFRIDSLRVPDTSEFGRVNERFQIVTLYQRSVEIEREDSGPTCTVLRTSGEQGIHLPEGWAWETRHGLSDSDYKALSLKLESLPESLSVVRIAHDAVGVSWDELDPVLTFDALKSHIVELGAIFDKQVV